MTVLSLYREILTSNNLFNIYILYYCGILQVHMGLMVRAISVLHRLYFRKYQISKEIRDKRKETITNNHLKR